MLTGEIRPSIQQEQQVANKCQSEKGRQCQHSMHGRMCMDSNILSFRRCSSAMQRTEIADDMRFTAISVILSDCDRRSDVKFEVLPSANRVPGRAAIAFNVGAGSDHTRLRKQAQLCCLALHYIPNPLNSKIPEATSSAEGRRADGCPQTFAKNSVRAT